MFSLQVNISTPLKYIFEFEFEFEFEIEIVLWRRVKVEGEVILQKWTRDDGFGSKATNWQRWVYSLFARSTRFASIHFL